MPYLADNKLNNAIFLDRDGVINTERGDYTYRISDFTLNEGVIKSLLLLQNAGFLLIIISNQGGIAKNLYSIKDVKILHIYLEEILKENLILLNDILFCPHHQDYSKCLCRKPDSLLIERAIHKHTINPSTSFLIGDKQRDIEAGEKAGIKGIKIKPNENLYKVAQSIIKSIE